MHPRAYLVEGCPDGRLLGQGAAHEAHELMQQGDPSTACRHAGLLTGRQRLQAHTGSTLASKGQVKGAMVLTRLGDFPMPADMLSC